MNQRDDLDQLLASWLDDPLTLPAPGYLAEVLDQTRQLRQRPSWASLERWLPMSITLRNPTLPLPTRPLTIGLALLLALLIALAGLPFLGGVMVSPAPPEGSENGLIAFDRDGDIYVVDPPDGEPRLLVGGPTEDVGPVWSRDGRRLAFLRVDGASEMVMVTDASGTTLVPMSPEPLEGVAGGGWSPDSTMLAVAHAVDGVPTISVFMADGSGLVPSEAGAPVAWSRADMPAWRPTGGTSGRYGLLYRSNDPQPTLMLGDVPKAAHGNEQAVLRLEDIDGGRDSRNGWSYDFLDPAFSPTGDRFAYHTLQDLGAYPDDPGFRVHIGRLGEGGAAATDTRLEYDAASNDEFHPLWSPDGTRIAFVALRNDSARLVIAEVAPEVDTITSTVVTVPLPGPAWDSLRFAWAPDSSSLAAVDVGVPDATYLVDAATGALQALPWTADGDPSWQSAAG